MIEQYNNNPCIQVIFSNGNDTITLSYLIYEWDAAHKFYNLIKTQVDKNAKFHSDTSFYITKEDENEIIIRINNAIDKINVKYSMNLEHIDNNSDLNKLHCSPIKDNLWIELNDAIHAYEQYKVQIDQDPRINAYFEFIDGEEILLEPEDYLFFTPDRNFGDLCINYSHKGKHWLELQSDNDIEAITNGELQPETIINSGGYMVFRPPSPSPFYRMNKFVKWYKKNVPNSKFDLNMAIGYLLVGKLIMPTGWDELSVSERSNWTRLLATYKNIIEIKTTYFTTDMIPNLLEKAKMNVFIK
jgi:hypothetical protein